jgi:hypothetical protein
MGVRRTGLVYLTNADFLISNVYEGEGGVLAAFKRQEIPSSFAAVSWSGTQ